jgi:5-oxoprolinase (ATP-hydrolysing) subunit B
MRDAFMAARPETLPLIAPLGDAAIIIRFAPILSDKANQAAIAFARRLDENLPTGVLEIDPNLVSVLIRYDPHETSFSGLAGELRLRFGAPQPQQDSVTHVLQVRFGGEDGPDLAEAAGALGLSEAAFVAQHNQQALRVLTTGFAPGFVYCGFHSAELTLPRRQAVRSRVEPGSILFAVGQTAICATPIPTGWHVIGRTDFRNFDPQGRPPTVLREGDFVQFEPC